jgi:transportin-1
VPDYIAYLAYILTHMPEQPERIRSIAAYLLKNNARSIVQSTSPAAAQFVKAAILAAFQDPMPQVRSAAGQCIVTLLGILEPRNWPEALQLLVAQLDDPEPERQEVSRPAARGFTR